MALFAAPFTLGFFMLIGFSMLIGLEVVTFEGEYNVRVTSKKFNMRKANISAPTNK